MNYRDTTERLAAYRDQIAAIRSQMRALQGSVEPDAVRDYEFNGPEGVVRLSALFADRDTLFVVHNMGRGCAHCTMWADGFNGIYPHVRKRAAFVVSSPDAPEIQQALASQRGWAFPMVSHRDSAFADDMGYFRNGRFMPGISVFRRKAGKILRVSDAKFDVGDDFCAIWRLFDLMPDEAPAVRS